MKIWRCEKCGYECKGEDIDFTCPECGGEIEWLATVTDNFNRESRQSI